MSATTLEILNVALFAASVAIAGVGLSTWRSQLRGRVEIDAAKRVLVGTLRFRSAIRGSRTPFSSYDPKEIDPDRSLPPDEFRYAVLNSELDRRWNRILDGRVDLDAALLEAEVIWGEECLKVFKSLWSVQDLIFQAYLEKRDLENPIDPDTSLVGERTRIGRTIYGRGGDSLDQSLQQAVEKIKDQFSNHLQPQPPNKLWAAFMEGWN